MCPSLRVLQWVAPPVGRLQNPRLQFRGEHCSDLSQVPAAESRDTLLGKPFAPTGHNPPAAIEALGHFITRVAPGKQQDQTRPSGIFRPPRWLLARLVRSISSAFVKVIASLMGPMTVTRQLVQTERVKAL